MSVNLSIQNIIRRNGLGHYQLRASLPALFGSSVHPPTIKHLPVVGTLSVVGLSISPPVFVCQKPSAISLVSYTWQDIVLPDTKSCDMTTALS